MDNRNKFKQQLDAYKSLIDSFDQNMKSGKGLMKSIEDSTKTYQRILKENFKNNMSTDYKSLGDDLREYEKFLRKYKIATRDAVDDIILEMERLGDDTEHLDKMVDNFYDAMDQMDERARQSSNNIKDSMNGIANWIQVLQLDRIASAVDDKTSGLLESTKRLQIATGNDHDSTSGFRDGYVKELHSQLNEETGNKYNLQDMYSDIADLAESTNLSRMETLEEVARPVLIATKSMNLSLESISSLAGKMYEQSGYDAMHMEATVDYMRKVTEGMNVDENKIVSNIDSLYNTVVAFSNKQLTADDLQGLTEGITAATTVLEDSGLDSSAFMKFMKDLREDAGSEASILAQRLGLNRNELIKNMEEGQEGWLESTRLYVESLSRAFDVSPERAQTYAGMLGVDSQEMVDAKAVVRTGKFYESLEGVEKNAESQSKAVDSIEDQFLDYKTQAENYMSGVLSELTLIKEKLGFGLTDLAAVVGIGSNLWDIGKSIFSLFGGKGGGIGGAGKLLGKGGRLAAAGSSIVGGLGAVGTALGSGATTAAGLATVGGASILGGVAGGVGIIDGGVDIYHAIKGKNADGTDMTDKERQDKGFSGGTKLAMVGTGAAAGAAIGSVIPVVGTAAGALIGAGIGGLTALFKGDEAGEALSDTWDGVKEAFDPVEEAGTEASLSIQNAGLTIADATRGAKESIWREADASYQYYNGQLYGVPSYDVGTNYVTSDQLAYVHEGEAIIPKEYNPNANPGLLDNSRQIENLTTAVSNIARAVNSILTTLADYSSATETRYQESKLSSRINASRAIVNSSEKDRVTGDNSMEYVSPTYLGKLYRA